MIPVGVLMGGKSSEHDVSLRSSSFIYNTLDRSLFKVKPIFISKDGFWYYSDEWNPNWKVPEIPVNEDYSKNVLASFVNLTNAKPKLAWQDPSCGGCKIFVLGLHGGEGEDGRMQAFLEMTGISYTGSGVLASSLAMDKYRSNLIFQSQGIPVAKFAEIKKDEFLKLEKLNQGNNIWQEWNQAYNLSFPVFCKPTTGGSSLGTFRSDNEDVWQSKLKKIFETENRMLVQENTKGREVSCGVLERWDGAEWSKFALPPTEIIPSSEFFDYEAKYIPGKSREVTPAEMPKEIIDKIQRYSLLAHNALGCRAYSRTDFIVTEDGTPWILETNTLPGMTGTSLIPQQASAVGISMKDVFSWLVQSGLER
ncbi:MAG: D-alanine--D-alanine ligase [Leptospiraceae bacterium]|nr:D-alanine--D-alanine ligase [Leptospiraceae bacterium]MCZ8346448.1 D-alanine--D-alanine ligase [Leptospiraceae bacterium]